MISGQAFVSECSLTPQEATELMPNYVFGQASQSFEYSLRKATTNDQDGKQVDSYQDASGRVVAQRSTISANNHAITLFVYNLSDQLVKVIDPRKLATTYRYNLNGLVIEKCSPDEGCKRYIYDASGRVVVEQDAKLKAEHSGGEGFRLYHYDKFGSLVKQERRVLYNTSAIPFSNYTGSSFRRVNTFRFSSGSNYGQFSALQYTTNSRVVPEKEWVYYGPNMTTPIYLHSKARSFFMDKSYRWGRLAHTLSYNHYGKAVQLEIYNYNSKGQIKDFVVQTNLRGIEDASADSVHLIRNTYTFTGQLDKQEIDINTDCRLDFYTRYIYDRYDRLKEVYAGHQSNAANPYKIASYQYRDQDDLLSKASYHQNNQLINDAFYYYDAHRDRLTRMDDAHLTWDLFYDNTMPAGVTGLAPNYNGNINATKSLYKWTAAGPGVGRTYRYQYDGMNRLTFAGTDQAANGVNGNETFVYDKSGNLTSITRATDAANHALTYSISGSSNRLNSLSLSGSLSRTMEYDPNGNMTKNGRVGLDYKLFKYGQSNLPYAYYRDIPPTNGDHTNEDSLWLLYGVNDLRIGLYQPNHTYLDVGISHYLRDHTGRELAMNEHNADGSNSKWTYYVFGHAGQRIASYQPTSFYQPDASYHQGVAIGGNTDPHGVTTEVYPLTGQDSYDYWIGAAGALEVGRLRIPTNSPGSTYFIYQTDPDLNKNHHLRLVSNDYIELREGATIGGLEAESRVSIFTLDPGAFCSTFDNTDMPDMKYHTYDHLGNLRVTYRRVGASLPVDATYEYSPYGRVVQTYRANTHKDRYLSTGHEREAATDYDYRLARLYDAELGRFLGVDAHNEKYSNLSSFSYAAGNPIIYVDPDGKDIRFAKEVVNGKTVITVTVTGKLINESSNAYTKEQMQNYADRIVSVISSAYSGEDGDVVWKGVANISVASSNSDLSKTDHAFRIVDQGKIPLYEGVMGATGMGVHKQNVVYLSSHIMDNHQTSGGIYAGTGKTVDGRATLERVSSHELGHSANYQGHPREGTLDGNLMHQSRSKNAGLKLTKDQILKMQDDYERGLLNQGTQEIWD
jgi:RHS repeat-associated protein